MSNKNSGAKTVITFIFLILVLVGAGIGTFFLVSNNNKTDTKQELPKLKNGTHDYRNISNDETVAWLNGLDDKTFNKEVKDGISNVQTLDKYKGISKSEFDQVLENINKAGSRDEKIEVFTWSITSAISSYEEDLKMNLISYSELKEKLKNKEDFIVMYSQPLCPHCLNLKKDGFKENYEKAVKSGKKVYMLNLALEQEAWNDLSLWDKSKNMVKSDSDNKGIPGTPSVAYYEKGIMKTGITSEKWSEVSNWLNKIDMWTK